MQPRMGGRIDHLLEKYSVRYSSTLDRILGFGFTVGVSLSSTICR
jgi:hypothetical protein